MNKKTLILIIIFLALLATLFAYNYFTRPIANAPTTNPESTTTNSNFHGPTGAPSIKGPTGPPPGN
ncbi:MAG: hypothetical protein WC461_02105 [Candidatus Paceibacterota bacterium]